MFTSINIILQQRYTSGDKETERERTTQRTNKLYLKIASSIGKHQLSQIHLKLLERTRQLPSRKHKALWNLIACDMVHTRLLLLHNRLHKHLLLLFNSSNKKKTCKPVNTKKNQNPFGCSENGRNKLDTEKPRKQNTEIKTRYSYLTLASHTTIFSYLQIKPYIYHKNPQFIFFSFLSFSQQPSSWES